MAPVLIQSVQSSRILLATSLLRLQASALREGLSFHDAATLTVDDVDDVDDLVKVILLRLIDPSSPDFEEFKSFLLVNNISSGFFEGRALYDVLMEYRMGETRLMVGVRFIQFLQSDFMKEAFETGTLNPEAALAAYKEWEFLFYSPLED